MSSIKRSNAATLYPSSLYDDDIEAALKTNLLTENEKETADADAGAEYDSDDEDDNKHMSLAMKINNCYSFAVRLLWVLITVLTTWYSIAHPPASFLFGTQEALQQTHPPVPLLGGCSVYILGCRHCPQDQKEGQN
eukprot:scaffold4231_cov131-Alexandrium_tamarense.AAC.1